MPGWNLLVAEDDDAASALVKKYLEAKGHVVKAVADGQSALDEIRKGSFDLAILDVMMPRLSGFDVLQRARADGDTTPIIMATAAASADDIVRALDLGADDYVTKPYSFPVLLARIELRLRLRAPTGPIKMPAKELPVDSTPTSDVDPRAAAEVSLVSDDMMVEEAEEAPPESSDASLLSRLKSVAQRFTRSRTPLERLAPGTMLADRYLVGEQIGSGGFGAVWRGRHVELDQDVAIKVLHPGARGEAIDAFRKEAQKACRVRHPNAVRVLDFGMLGGGAAYLVMELLEGPTLEQLLQKRTPLSVERASEIMRPVLAALAAAHNQGIVHRDVKPSNVVLHVESDMEVPKLLDFGIAKDIDGPSGDSAGVVLGSAAYIAPERLRGERYDGRADVYACGIMLYRMLTGAMPFDARIDDFENLALWHIHTPPPAPSSRVPALSQNVDDVLLRLMAKDPAKRPSAADACTFVESMIW